MCVRGRVIPKVTWVLNLNRRVGTNPITNSYSWRNPDPIDVERIPLSSIVSSESKLPKIRPGLIKGSLTTVMAKFLAFFWSHISGGRVALQGWAACIPILQESSFSGTMRCFVGGEVMTFYDGKQAVFSTLKEYKTMRGNFPKTNLAAETLSLENEFPSGEPWLLASTNC